MNVKSGAVVAAAALLSAVIVSGCALLAATGLDASAPPIPVDGIDEEVTMPRPDESDAFPAVLAAELRSQPDGTYEVRVTLSSPYDSPQRYADGWRVLDADGNTLGSHTLMHDHAAEQPFTRTQTGLVIPSGVTSITVQGHDQANGYGGATLTVSVPEP